MLYPIFDVIIVILLLLHHVASNGIDSAHSDTKHKFQYETEDTHLVLQPNYDEYMFRASLNHWSPISPVDKFMDVIESFEMEVEYVFYNCSKSKQDEAHTVIDMKHYEMRYLVEVLKRPLNK